MIGNKKVLISGITGFIGSNIAKFLLDQEFKIIGIFRDQSDLKRCLDFKDKIGWINISNENWQNEIINFKPDIFIHTAWEGIDAQSRNNWDIQLKNFTFSQNIISACINGSVKKIISLGSQAEYGLYSGKISENYCPKPADAYGAYKLHTSNFLKINCQDKDIHWYWLRIFSVFGPGENETWLIPHAIKSLLKNESVILTKGDQKYDYLYIEDFTKNLLQIINHEKDNSGIYNFGSGSSISIKEFLLNLTEIIGVSYDLLKFGAVPYRAMQSMHMESDNTLIESIFGQMVHREYKNSLIETVNNSTF